MRCPTCSQESIYIEIDHESQTHVKCNLCKIDEILTGFPSKFINFQIDAEEAYQQGIVDCISGKIINDNPGDTLVSHYMWEKGFKEEKEQEDEQVSSFSAKKGLEEKSEELIKKLDKMEKYDSIIVKFCKSLTNHISVLKGKKYLLGKSYRKDIKKISQDIHKFLKDNKL